jgi:hypothetical protein
VVAETKLLCYRCAPLGIDGRGEQMGRFQSPPASVVERRETVPRRQMATEHLPTPAAIETNDKIAAKGSADGDRGLTSGSCLRLPEMSKRMMHRGNKLGHITRRNLGAREVAPKELCNQMRTDHFYICHSPVRAYFLSTASDIDKINKI